MADRGDKLIFKPFRLGQILRHLVDGLAQTADFIIVGGIRQADFHIALGDFGCGGLHLAQRAHDGAHKKQPAPHRNQQHQQPQPHRQRDGVPPLLVGKAQAGDQPHGGDVARRVGHQHGFGHDTLALRGGVDVVASALQECQREVVAAGQVGAADTAAVCQNDARCVQQHKFKLVFFVELLHRAAQGAGAAFGGDSGIARRAARKDSLHRAALQMLCQTGLGVSLLPCRAGFHGKQHRTRRADGIGIGQMDRLGKLHGGLLHRQGGKGGGGKCRRQHGSPGKGGQQFG